MAWWKRRAVHICEVCGAKMRTGSAILIEQDYWVGGERKTVRDICEACRQRHFPRAEEVLARLRDGDAEERASAARELARPLPLGNVRRFTRCPRAGGMAVPRRAGNHQGAGRAWRACGRERADRRRRHRTPRPDQRRTRRVLPAAG